MNDLREESPVTPKADDRPAYEPPRIVKKRSVARATLSPPANRFNGVGADGGGLTASG